MCYAGKISWNIHDYYKFIFIKFLNKKFKKSIGLNWYLVDPNEIGLFEQKKMTVKKETIYLKEINYL